MEILLVALGVAITTLTIAGVIGFLLGFVGGAIGATGLVIIIRGER